jgi:hypothetical protein
MFYNLHGELAVSGCVVMDLVVDLFFHGRIKLLAHKWEKGNTR